MALDLNGLSQDEQFAKAAEFAGVPESVLRGQWKMESSEGKNMLSPAGAEGHFGIMPATRKTWEQRTGRAYDPNNFSDALTLNALTMQENVQATHGNVADALRMYNAGTNRSHWNNDETNNYVSKLTGESIPVMDGTGFSVRNNPNVSPLTEEEVWNTSAFDLRNKEALKTSGSTPTEHLNAFEKGELDTRALAAAVNAETGGQDAFAAAQAARSEFTAPELTTRATENMTQAPSLDFDNSTHFAAQEAREKTLMDAQAEIDKLGFKDKFSAAFSSNTITAALWRSIRDYESGLYTPQEGFDTLAPKVRDDIYRFANNREDIEEQERAVSEHHLEVIRKGILAKRKDEYTVAAGSSGAAQLAYGLAAGLLDPVGWAAGLGVSKGFQLAGVGARVAFKAGQVGRGLALASAEGAVGNLAATGLIDAFGEHQTSHDYAFAAGTGLFFGAAFGAFDHFGGRKEAARESMMKHAQDLQNAAMEADAKLYSEVQADLGPNATKAQVVEEATRRNVEQQKRVMEAVLASAPDEEQLLPRLDPETVAAYKAEWKGESNETPKMLPGAILNTKKAVLDVSKKYGLDLTIADSGERAIAAEMYARAERFMAANPVDKDRATKLLAAGGLESTAQRMLLSDNPLAQMVGSVLLENPSGIADRRITAAMTAKTRERIYMHNVLNEYENSFAQWRKMQGSSAIGDFFNNGAMRKRFDKEVYALRDRRVNGVATVDRNPDVDGVTRMANLLDDAYERMRVEQKHVGTLGSMRLSDDIVRGYQPRRWAVGSIRGMTGGRFKAFTEAVSWQMQNVAGYDKKFADNFSREYANIARQRAMGSYDIPVNLHDADAADMIRDALKAMGAEDISADQVAGRFSRGGANHTNHRIEMDLTRQFTDTDGLPFQLLDFVDTDNMSLLRNYARRTAGEVSLAKFGVLGEPGMNILRQAITAGLEKNNPKNSVLEAFDQIAAEFLGKPYGTHLGKWADNARVLASAVRLGGMGFTQMGESANMFAALGVEHATKGVASLPRMFTEARKLVKGEHVDNPILGSIELYTGELGLDGYRMQGLYDVNDGFEVYGREALDRGTRAIRAANHGVRVLSGHRAVVAAQVRGVSEQIALKALKYMRAGVEDAALKDMGFSDELVSIFRREMKTRVSVKGERTAQGWVKFGDDGHVTHLDLTKMRDQVAANAFAQAVQRGAAQIIQETFIGETGKWAHNGLLKMLMQFRTFSMISVEKQWNRQVGVHGMTKMIGFTLGAMAMAVPLHLARVVAKAKLMDDEKADKYIDQNLDPLVLGRVTMNYASTLGVLPDLIDGVAAVVGKGDDPNSARAYLSSMGGRSASRGDGFLGGSIAPAIGLVNDIGRLATQHDLHTLARLTPGASIPQFQAAMGILGEAAEEVQK